MLVVTALSTHIQDKRLLLLPHSALLLWPEPQEPGTCGAPGTCGWGLAGRSTWKRGVNLYPKVSTVPSSALGREASWEYLLSGLVWRLRSPLKGA